MALANKTEGRRYGSSWLLLIIKLIRYLSNAVESIGAHLTRKRIITYLPLPVTLLWIPYIARHLAGDFPRRSYEVLIKSDFLAYYTGGKFALSGTLADLYSLDGQYQMQFDLISRIGGADMSLYISPPFVTYLYAPFASLSYGWAVVSWMILTVALLACSVRLIWPLVPNIHHFGFSTVLLIILASFPAIDLISSGQNGALSLFLMTAALRLLLAGYHRSSGAILGIGVYKPQLFLMFPLLLALERRWKAFAGWTAVAALLCALSMWAVGADGVRAYLSLLTSDLYHERILSEFGWKMNTVGSLARSLVHPALLAGPVVTIMNLIVLAAGALILTRAHQQVRRSVTGTDAITLSFALTVLISVMFAPHVFNYDSVLLILPFMVLLNMFPASAGLKVAIASAYAISVASPVTSIAVSGMAWPTNVLAAPWAVVPVLACLVIALRCIQERQLRSTNPTPDAAAESAPAG